MSVDIYASCIVAFNAVPSELLDVKLSTDELNDKERKLITAYRTKTELQSAIDILLGVK